ncbi:hypothetical protein AB434_0660 [Heyndrickxia coagulans]|uniref:Uncharacterized protein n=1 Tax=Heyndrickxia coagulans TaxID=1398 RepID=A0AAN0WAM5_HEYCO|nr:hypothetical protein SB48_HM08orf00778 [Heyndrickxia coagulans]AKN53065.1 hypothetical protein AB434_0660 [Heyndrickxia coagulans]ATW81917.1 hypothetical protein CIW84_02295 [Heyndrickxia coagulans]KGB29592.1 hypothetical protein IE89_09985 [Heyndrickxia coagulans]KXT19967.1 hypothetical protein UZ35_12265 [Heyndrickxia coagulans]
MSIQSANFPYWIQDAFLTNDIENGYSRVIQAMESKNVKAANCYYFFAANQNEAVYIAGQVFSSDKIENICYYMIIIFK